MSFLNDTLLSFGMGALASFTFMELMNYQKEHKTKAALMNSSSGQNVPEHIKEELLARVKTFFGEAGLERIKNSYVVVSFLP